MMDYDDRVLSTCLTLRAVSPDYRQKIAEDYAAMLAENFLSLPPHGGKMPCQYLTSRTPLISRHAV
jgi:hypothetical protein